MSHEPDATRGQSWRCSRIIVRASAWWSADNALVLFLFRGTQIGGTLGALRCLNHVENSALEQTHAVAPNGKWLAYSPMTGATKSSVSVFELAERQTDGRWSDNAVVAGRNQALLSCLSAYERWGFHQRDTEQRGDRMWCRAPYSGPVPGTRLTVLKGGHASSDDQGAKKATARTESTSRQLVRRTAKLLPDRIERVYAGPLILARRRPHDRLKTCTIGLHL